MTDRERYEAALLDWLACAAGGAAEPTARAARGAGEGLLERVTAAGVAGHVLDYDDTYAPGVIHASACAAPAALVLGAARGADVGEVLDAYAAGFEAAAALARVSHPTLYDRGWHPTSVCGTVGAAVSAARLAGVDERQASALALLRAGGLRAAFGSDGKSLQVGMAAAAGVQCAQLVQAGASVSPEAIAPGFELAFGARRPRAGDPPAIRENWIKPWPCCLATHSTIEAVAQLPRAEARAINVTVHPLARQAAALDDVTTALAAKFSIPYLAAYTRLHGPPRLASFTGVDDAARILAREAVSLRTDDSLGEWEARVSIGEDGQAARIATALGSPARPLDPGSLAAKVRELAGDRLSGALRDPARPAAELLAAAGLQSSDLPPVS